MLKRILCLVLLAVLLVPAWAAAEEVVNVYNWEDYIAAETLDMFTKETGITVNLMNFTTNEDMLVKVRNSPSSFDVVFPSDYCIERMIAEDLLAPIDYANVPNMQYIDPNLLKPTYDPTGEYSADRWKPSVPGSGAVAVAIHFPAASIAVL